MMDQLLAEATRTSEMDMKTEWITLFTNSVPIHMGHELVTKEITVKEFRQEQLFQVVLEIATKDDPFDTFSVVISDFDFQKKFQHGQQVKASFKDFGTHLAEILEKIRDPLEYYDAYFEPISSVKSNLVITFATPLKSTNHLVIEVLKVAYDQLKEVVSSTINNLKLKIGQLEDDNNDLTKKLEEIEAEKVAENCNKKYLREALAKYDERIHALDDQHDQKLEELERVNLENFINYQNEIKDEMRTLQLTNNSLQVLNRILETESVVIKKKLWKENKELRSTKKAKAQVDKDIKILKAKITKCNMGLNDNRAHISYLLNENYQLKKNVNFYFKTIAELNESLANIISENATVSALKKDCEKKQRALCAQIKVVEHEKKEFSQRCLLVENRNKILEKKHRDFVTKLEQFQSELAKGSATIEEYSQIIVAKNCEINRLLFRLVKLEDELKQHPLPDRDVGDEMALEEGPRSKIPRPTVACYLQTKFSEDEPLDLATSSD